MKVTFFFCSCVVVFSPNGTKMSSDLTLYVTYSLRILFGVVC